MSSASGETSNGLVRGRALAGRGAAQQFGQAERRRGQVVQFIRVLVNARRPFAGQIDHFQIQFRDIIQQGLQHGLDGLVLDRRAGQQFIGIGHQQFVNVLVPLVRRQKLPPALGALKVEQPGQGAADAGIGQQHVGQIARRHQRRQDGAGQRPGADRAFQPGAALRGRAEVDDLPVLFGRQIGDQGRVLFGIAFNQRGDQRGGKRAQSLMALYRRQFAQQAAFFGQCQGRFHAGDAGGEVMDGLDFDKFAMRFVGLVEDFG